MKKCENSAINLNSWGNYAVVMKVEVAFRPGDSVIYRMTKHSVSPGPRAKKVAPSSSGEDYKYQVDKFWVVDEVLDNGDLLIRTRRGKIRQIRPDDPNLRSPSWWENLFYRSQFPSKEKVADLTGSEATR